MTPLTHPIPSTAFGNAMGWGHRLSPQAFVRHFKKEREKVAHMPVENGYVDDQISVGSEYEVEETTIFEHISNSETGQPTSQYLGSGRYLSNKILPKGSMRVWVSSLIVIIYFSNSQNSKAYFQQISFSPCRSLVFLEDLLFAFRGVKAEKKFQRDLVRNSRKYNCSLVIVNCFCRFLYWEK